MVFVNGEMQSPHLAQFAPLHKGRSFICYRDVNKAIERHRELYGLRLMLKKAIKLENYCLTVDQMRDLNFRLKYGELDYQCLVDTGRPGRPGKDERCPRLIRLRLSPDARTLVVYDTHIHEPVFNSPSQVQAMSPPYALQGVVPEVPFKGDSSASPSSIGQMTPSSTSSTPTSSNIAKKGSSPSLSPGYEKITVKLKKSQFSPNEMVVVGSPRDAQEQFEMRNTPEKTSSPAMSSSAKYCEKIDLPTRQLMEKLQENKSTTIVFKPLAKSPPHVVPELREDVLPPVNIMAKSLPKIAPKPREIQGSMNFDRSNSITVKPIEKEGKGDKKTDKQAVIKVPAKILPKQNKPTEKNDDKSSGKPSQKVVSKPPAEKSASRIVDKVPMKVTEKSVMKQSEKVVGRTVEKNGNKGDNGKAPVRSSRRCLDKTQKGSSFSNGSSRSEVHRNGVSYSSTKNEGVTYSSNGNKSSGGNGKKMYRKKRNRQSEENFDISTLLPLDTELGMMEKQQLAHGVLLRLLRVTSQLPMVEFTHALDTLEMMTDAFKLEQKVNLTIRQDEEEEEPELRSIDDDYYEEYYDFGNEVDAINEDHVVSVAQVDGSVDDSVILPESRDAHVPQKRQSYPNDEDGLSYSNLPHKNKMQRISL